MRKIFGYCNFKWKKNFPLSSFTTIKSSEYAGLTNALLDKALDFAKTRI